MPFFRLPFSRSTLSRIVAVASAVVLVALVLGCMNICVDRAITVGEDGISKQSGTIAVASGQELDVYYEIPYGTPPNLTLSSLNGKCVVIAQMPDHFRVRNTGIFTINADWEARGLRVPPPPQSLPVVTVPAQGLPPVPIPIEQK
jgi:hypothetical protein